MRRRSIAVCLAVLVAAASILASVAVAGPVGKPRSSADGNSQAIGAVVRPSRLYGKRFTPASLEVTSVLRTTTAANGVPVPTTDVRIDFDENGRIFTKGYPTCKASKLQNVSTEVARRECKLAMIGQGKATALLPVGNQVFVVKQTVTAFNGRPKGGKPVILLHSYGTTPVTTALVLVGTVTNYDKQGFGVRLDIKVPLIAGGAGALIRFNTTIRKRYRWRGKRRSYIYARCPNSKRLKLRSVFKSLDGQTTKPVYEGRCQQKPGKRRKRHR